MGGTTYKNVIQGEVQNLGLYTILIGEGEEAKDTHGKATSGRKKWTLMRTNGIYNSLVTIPAQE